MKCSRCNALDPNNLVLEGGKHILVCDACLLGGDDISSYTVKQLRQIINGI